MMRHCDGTDEYLSKFIGFDESAPLTADLEEFVPCDCGLKFDDVYRSTVYPHDEISIRPSVSSMFKKVFGMTFPEDESPSEKLYVHVCKEDGTPIFIGVISGEDKDTRVLITYVLNGPARCNLAAVSVDTEMPSEIRFRGKHSQDSETPPTKD